MDRRDFLKTSGAAAAALAGTASVPSAEPALAAPALLKGLETYRVAVAWPDTCAGPAESARRIARAVEEASNGRLKFAFSATPDASGALRRGEADLSFASEHDLTPHHRAFAYFGGLPGQHGMNPHHLHQWLLVGGGNVLWDDLSAGFELKSLLAGHTGESSGLWSRAPIEGVGALPTLKIWATGVAEDVVRGIGALPVACPASEIAATLADGRVDAAEFGGMIAASSLGIPKVASFRLPSAITPRGLTFSLGFTRAHWQSLTRTDQVLFENAAQTEFQTLLAEETAHTRLMPLADSGREARAAAFDIAQAVHRMSDAVIAHLAATDARSARINASYMAFRRMVRTAEAPTV